jgi:hypothetical protein
MALSQRSLSGAGGNHRSGRVRVGVTVEDLGRGRRIDPSTTLVNDDGFEEFAADERERIPLWLGEERGAAPAAHGNHVC